MDRKSVVSIATTAVLIGSTLIANSVSAQTGNPVTPIQPTPTAPVTPVQPSPTQPVTPTNPTSTPTPTKPVTPPVVTPTPTMSPTPSPTPKPTITPTPKTRTKISVFAAGTKAMRAFPKLEMDINGQYVKTFASINGDPNQGQFKEYKYTYKGELKTGDTVSLRFVNDWAFWHLGDRNVRIDKIQVGNTVYQTEDPSVKGEGAATPSYACGTGYLQTEWLYCNGYFEYTINP